MYSYPRSLRTMLTPRGRRPPSRPGERDVRRAARELILAALCSSANSTATRSLKSPTARVPVGTLCEAAGRGQGRRVASSSC